MNAQEQALADKILEEATQETDYSIRSVLIDQYQILIRAADMRTDMTRPYPQGATATGVAGPFFTKE